MLNKNFNEFLISYQQHHSPVDAFKLTDENFIEHEKLFLATLGIGLFETIIFFTVNAVMPSILGNG